MKSVVKMTLLLLSTILPSTVLANWSDPSVVLQSNRIKAGSSFSVAYYNAPASASIAIFPETATVADPISTQSVSEGKGSATLTIPSSALPHGYFVALCTGSGSSATVVGDSVLIVADPIGSGFALSSDKDTYPKGGTMTVTYANAPACAGDRIVVYPATYTVLPATDVNYTAPTYSADITASTGSASFKIAESGYYTVYYFLDGTYNTIFDSKMVLVGSPASVSVSKTKYIPEEDVVITFSGLSKKFNDWVGVFSSDSSLTDNQPAYRIDCKGHKAGTINVPGGTLPEGKYKVATFFNDSRTYSSTLARFTVATGTGSLAYVTDTTDVFYNIVSAKDGLAMADPATTASTSPANMKLVSLSTADPAQQWKLVKKNNGKIDFVNRASGNYLLTFSALSGNFNMTKIGQPDQYYHGWNVSSLGSNQYAIFGVEEDNILRYLSNATVGASAEPLDLTTNTDFAWTLSAVDTVATAIQSNHTDKNYISVDNGKILVNGTRDYSIWNADGKNMPKNTRLAPGVYVIRYKNGNSSKVTVK